MNTACKNILYKMHTIYKNIIYKVNIVCKMIVCKAKKSMKTVCKSMYTASLSMYKSYKGRDKETNLLKLPRPY